jgi:hypothetical protein
MEAQLWSEGMHTRAKGECNASLETCLFETDRVERLDILGTSRENGTTTLLVDSVHSRHSIDMDCKKRDYSQMSEGQSNRHLLLALS